MTDPNARTTPERLQFDRAVDAGAAPPDAEPAPSITCSRCQSPIKTYYYHVDGESVCASCKQAAERASTSQRSGGAWLRAAFLGFGAAVVGAIIYYGVIAITNFEIGIVAILIGFLVGAAVRKGAAGGGGRRYQLLAVALTYFSVGLAYSPIVFKGIMEGKAKGGAAAGQVAGQVGADSAAADVAPIAPGGETKAKWVGPMGMVLALGATFLFIFALPVIAVVGSLPSGLISALIIAIGMRQAWQMTGGHMVTITGPYKVGGAAAPPPASA